MNFALKIQYLLLILSFLLKDQLVWSQNRIVGGDLIDIEKVPYMLLLDILKEDGTGMYCGATILSKDWGLTAAHCFVNVTKNAKIEVTAGTNSIYTRKNTSKTYKVTEFITHEDFSRDPMQNDITVIRISPPITFNEATKAVKLPERGQFINRKWAVLSGWGSQRFSGSFNTELRYVRVPEVPLAECKRRYKQGNLSILHGAICYGFSNGTVIHDSCVGDSGGPLIAEGVQIGVVSYGVECGSRGVPSVSSDTLYYRDWIKSKTGI